MWRRAKYCFSAVTALTFFCMCRGDVAVVEVGAITSWPDGPMNPEALGLSLPSFRNGGLIVFLHIPKTGGTTIRRNLEALDRIDYVFGRNYTVYQNAVAKVEDTILHGTMDASILFFEVHATDAPSFYRMRKRLKRWRETAQQNQVPIFFFSLVRDPLDFAFSHFSFFHIQVRNPTFERCSANEENFLRLSLWNPQCQFLFKGEGSMRAQRQKLVVVQADECLEVQQHMWKLLDWVGTTERLSDETLPLLRQLLNLPEDFVFGRFKVSRESGETFGKENVTESSVATVLGRSALDSLLYENVQRIYQYSQVVWQAS